MTKTCPRLSASVLTACLLAACAPGAPADPTGPAAAPAAPLQIEARVARLHPRLGGPSFAWLRHTGVAARPGDQPAEVARRALAALAPTYALGPAAVQSARLHHVHDSGDGPIIARFQQEVAGLPVFGVGLNLGLRRADLAPVVATGGLARALRPRGTFTLDAAHAVGLAFQRHTGAALPAAALHPAAAVADPAADAADPAGYQIHPLDAVDVAGRRLVPASPPRTRRVWYPQTGGLVPAYYVELDLGHADAHDAQLRSYVISASDGAVLFQNNLTHADRYSYRVWADRTGDLRPWDGPQGNTYTPYPRAAPDGSSPALVSPPLVTLDSVAAYNSKADPWLGPAATEAKGNNVWAFADIVAPDGYQTGDIKVTPTSPGFFDRVYDPNGKPQGSTDSIQAIGTHLFYVLNFMHDYFYDVGWNEASGNPQQDNFKRGGLGNDPIIGEAQDFSGRNNANASVPADGASPRVRMYLFDSRFGERRLTVFKPAAVAGDYSAVLAQFGPRPFVLSGDLVLVDDGAGTATDACDTPFANAVKVAGKIALIDRGGCNFTVKADNAAKNGAVGVVIVNNVAGPLPGLGAGAGAPTITIPTMGLIKDDGDKLKAALGGATVSLEMFGNPIDRDGALDTGIVSHEWGHVLSQRLVGDANGLFTLQAAGMGEGWSDFVSLLTIARPEDATAPTNKDWMGVYPVGSFGYDPGNLDAYYQGLRRYPYSADLTKDPLTFKHIQVDVDLPSSPMPIGGTDGANNAEVHNTGEIWASMLWECYTALLRDPRYPFAAANQRMREYLVASLKLTPIGPTFIDARDALLAAAYARDQQDFQLFWAAFAKRGIGVGAEGPDALSGSNGPVTESFKTGEDYDYLGAKLDDSVKSCDSDGVLDNGETGELAIALANIGSSKITAASVTVMGGPNLVIPNPTVSFPPIEAYQVGVAKLRVSLTGAAPVSTVPITMQFSDPNLAVQHPLITREDIRVNYDDKPSASATDNLDTVNTAWSVAADAALDTSKKWRRARVSSRNLWLIEGTPAVADQYLVSPPLQVGAGLKFSFTHRYNFEVGAGVYGDGGVVEVSADNGATWEDLGPFLTAVGYTQTLADSNPVLKGRRGFGGVSLNYPTFQTTAVDTLARYAGKAVRVRFRFASDDGKASVGWDINQMSFDGLQNTPFSARVADQGLCDPRPKADAGPDQRVAPGAQVTLSGSGTGQGALTYRWTQTSGALVFLSASDTAQVTFQAPPDSQEVTTLTFALVVNDGHADSAPSTVTITVDPAAHVGGGGGCVVSGRALGGEAGAGGPGAPLLLVGLLGALWVRRGPRGRRSREIAPV